VTNYDNVLGSLARGGPGAVRYDGDSLTNDEEHQYRIDLAAMLEHETELIKFPDNVGSGATIAAAEEKINELRSMLLKTADGLRTIGEAAKKAAPPIRTGTAADPEVQAALRQSSAAYASVPDIVPPGTDGPDEHVIEGGHGPAPGGKPERKLASEESGPGLEASPATQVSSAAPQVAPAGAAQAAAPAAGMPQGAPGAPMAGPMAAGAGAPQMAPSGYSPGTGGGPAGGPQTKPRRREGDNGPTTYGSSSTGPEVGGGVMPLVNPSVTGGRVDPAQISGRTASTSPSAGMPPLRTGPAGSTGMMGGMGMPLGGGPHAGGGGGGGRSNLPPIRRDRESERILTGQEARDKALVSHILRDDDPVVGEYIDGADVLADLLPNERHPAPPQYGAEPPVPVNPATQPVVNMAPLAEPTGPLTEPTGPLSELPPLSHYWRHSGLPRLRRLPRNLAGGLFLVGSRQGRRSLRSRKTATSVRAPWG